MCVCVCVFVCVHVLVCVIKFNRLFDLIRMQQVSSTGTIPSPVFCPGVAKNLFRTGGLVCSEGTFLHTSFNRERFSLSYAHNKSL